MASSEDKEEARGHWQAQLVWMGIRPRHLGGWWRVFARQERICSILSPRSLSSTCSSASGACSSPEVSGVNDSMFIQKHEGLSEEQETQSPRRFKRKCDTFLIQYILCLSLGIFFFSHFEKGKEKRLRLGAEGEQYEMLRDQKHISSK